MIRRYRSSAAARWLPRTLGGAVLAASLIAARGIDPAGATPGGGTVRLLVILFGAALSLWVVRSGAVLYREVEVRDDALWVGIGERGRELEYRDVVTLDYHGPFGSGRRWAPVMAIRDRLEHEWLVPGTLEGGPEFVAEFLRACDRSDLDAWADARRVASRFARADRWVVAGYVLAAAAVIAAVVFHAV